MEVNGTVRVDEVLLSLLVRKGVVGWKVRWFESERRGLRLMREKWRK